MSARSRMTHRCTVQRSSHDDSDRYDVPDFETSIESQPCWMYTRDGREVVRAEGTVNVDPLKMLMPKGTDIVATDRLVDVMIGEATYFGGVFDVESVLPHHTHLELVLRRVSGASGQQVPT